MASIRAMTTQIRVSDLEASISFYRSLGFDIEHSFTPDGSNAPTWVSLRLGPASLMLGIAEGFDPEAPRDAVFYIYCEDVAGMHSELSEKGLDVSGIEFPVFNPRGEFHVTDPDRYTIYITHT